MLTVEDEKQADYADILITVSNEDWSQRMLSLRRVDFSYQLDWTQWLELKLMKGLGGTRIIVFTLQPNVELSPATEISAVMYTTCFCLLVQLTQQCTVTDDNIKLDPHKSHSVPGAAEPRGPGGQLTPPLSRTGSTNGAWPHTFVWFPCHNHCPYSTNRCAKCEVCWTNLSIIIHGSDFRDPGTYPKNPVVFWGGPTQKNT